MIRTPSNLEFLLHCYYSSEKHPRYKAPAIMEARSYLLGEDIIVTTDAPYVYNVTDRGEAYIKYLMAVPFPQKTWTMPAVAEAKLVQGDDHDR